MPARRIPAYRHHKARNLAVVTLNGRDIYLGEFDSPESRAKYDTLIADWLCRNHEPPPPGAECSLPQLMAAYLIFAKGYYVKNGEQTREFGCITEALREVRRLYPDVKMSEFGPRALKAVRERMVELGWCRKYINKQIGRIVRMVKWGVSEELVAPGVYQALSTIAGLRKGRTEAPDHEPVKPVADADVNATIPHLTAVLADMVRLQRLSGARPGEITSLRPMDVSCGARVWRFRPDSHKTEHHDRERIIFLGPRAQKVLAKYLDRAPDQYCFSPRESEELRRSELHRQRRTPLNYGNTRKPRYEDGKRLPSDCYTTGSYRRAIQRACAKAGISKWSPNQIRHTAGTEVRRKRGLEAAQTVLGHASADVTQIYAERDMELAASVAMELG
ncbi:MAG: site-specific integrase [Planctomycetaceae bacterium]